MARDHVEIVHSDEIASQPLPASGWPHGAEALVLSRDGETGAFSGVLVLPAGWRRGPGWLTADSEHLVLDGSLRIGSELRSFGWYEWLPAGSTQEQWTTDEGCRILFLPRTGAPDFVPGQGADPPGRIAIDTELVQWQASPIPGPPPGLVFKVLRHVPETGETAALYSGPHRRDYGKLEFHDCVEEIFLLGGDTWLGNSGSMRPGSYFWRPPYITHGPFYSRGGSFAYLYADSTLVNHFVDDPRSTPERNVAQAAAEEPARNYIHETGVA